MHLLPLPHHLDVACEVSCLPCTTQQPIGLTSVGTVTQLGAMSTVAQPVSAGTTAVPGAATPPVVARPGSTGPPKPEAQDMPRFAGSSYRGHTTGRRGAQLHHRRTEVVARILLHPSAEARRTSPLPPLEGGPPPGEKIPAAVAARDLPDGDPWRHPGEGERAWLPHVWFW